jgi:fibronectin type 3 domain-containing protein
MAKYEFYDGATTWYGFGGSDWAAQTFTPQANHTLKSIKLELRSVGAHGDVTVGVRATAGGKPTGADLGSGTIADADVPDAGDWVCVDISPNVGVSSGTTYAIVVRATGDSGNNLQWRMKPNWFGPDAYPRGEFCMSSDGGSSWLVCADVLPGCFYDANFEERDEVCPEVAPDAPSGLVATASSGSCIGLTWQDNSDNEDGFKIERSTSGSASFSQIDTVGENVESYDDTTVDDGTLYCYRVRAYNEAGNSGYSNVSCDTTPLFAPTGLSAVSVSDTQVDLTWQDNSASETGYKIERSTSGSLGFSQIDTVGADEEEYSDTTVEEYIQYCYRVRAYNDTGNSDYSNVSCSTSLLAAPTNLTAVPLSSTVIKLTWTDNTPYEDGYKIERQGSWSEVGDVGAGITEYLDTGLSGGTSYTYRVRAYADGTYSAYSATETTSTFTPIEATSVSMTIGGIDVSDYICSLTTEQDICRLAQTFEVSLDTSLASSFSPWNEVLIAIEGENRLAGYVDDVQKGRNPTEYVVLGKDYMKLAIDTLITEKVTVEEVKDAGWWIDYWLTQVMIPSGGAVETGFTVPLDLEWQYVSVGDIILECLGYAGGGWTVIVDGNGTAQITEKLVGEPDHTITTHLEFAHEQDDSWYRNRAVVFGTSGSVTEIAAEYPASEPADARAVALSSDFIYSELAAEDIAEQLVKFFDENLNVKRCFITGNETIWLGETARIIESWTGFNNIGLITSIITTIDDGGFRQLVSLDEKCGFIWGWGRKWQDQIRLLRAYPDLEVPVVAHTYYGSRDAATVNHYYPNNALFDSSYALSWSRCTAGATGNYPIYHCNSADGETWSDEVEVDDVAYIGVTGWSTAWNDMATDSEGNIYIVWQEKYGHVYLSKSTDGGDSFESSVQVDDASQWAWVPYIAIDSSDNIYVVWFTRTMEGGSECNDMRISKSINGGESFGASVLIEEYTWDTGANPGPLYPEPGGVTANDADEILLAYVRTPHLYSDFPYNEDSSALMFRKSTNGGESFSSALMLDCWELYISPTGHIDSSGSWANEERAYDNNKTTYATTTDALEWDTWSEWLYLTHYPITSDRVAYTDYYLPQPCVIPDVDFDIEVHTTSGSWISPTPIFPMPSYWKTYGFDEAEVDQVRYRTRHHFVPMWCTSKFKGRCYEIKFYKSSDESDHTPYPKILSSGEDDIYIGYIDDDGHFYLTKSNDGGDTFNEVGDNVKIDSCINTCSYGSLILPSSGSLCAVWQSNNRIYRGMATDLVGDDFGASVIIDNCDPDLDEVSTYPSLLLVDGEPYVTYRRTVSPENDEEYAT